MALALPLVPLAIARIAALESDDAKESEIAALIGVLSGIQTPPEELANEVEALLSLSASLRHHWYRVRSFRAVTEGIGAFGFPRVVRGGLLDRSLELCEKIEDAAERVDLVSAVIEAMIGMHWGDDNAFRLGELAEVAAALPDERSRARSVARVALVLARADEIERAVAELDKLPASAQRARCLADVAIELLGRDREEEAVTLLERALTELGEATESAEKATALRLLLGRLVDGHEGGEDDPLAQALKWCLAIAATITDARHERDAIEGAIERLGDAQLGREDLDDLVSRLEVVIEGVTAADFRAELWGALGLRLSIRGDVDAAERLFARVAELAACPPRGERAPPPIDLPSALPLPQALSAMAEAEVPTWRLERTAALALEMLQGAIDREGATGIVIQLAWLLASPAFHYQSRIALFVKALAVAERVASPTDRVDVVTAIANGLSIAGATELGDGVFAGLVALAGPVAARPARYKRAIALIRLSRTADAHAQLTEAGVTLAPDDAAGFTDLGANFARCGFLADMLAQLERIAPEKQDAARAAFADALVDSTYLDPYLRELGLSSLLPAAEGLVAEAIACMLAQLRLLEELGDPSEVVAQAFERTAAIPHSGTAALFEKQLVRAMIERVRRSSR